MSVLKNKIDFVAIVSVNMANPNGDPLNGNRPRTDFEGIGQMSSVCIKRKLRNRMQDFGQKIFLQSEDRCDDKAATLAERAEKEGFKTIKNQDEFYIKACEKWIDVRTFGQVFPFNNLALKSVSITGPVSIHEASSADVVEIESIQITKSVSGELKEKQSRSSDTMGMKHFVKFGAYIIKGTVSVQLAEKTGFSEEDAEILKESLRTLFVNDASSARPDGSMEVINLYWFEHNCKEGQYPSARVHRSIKVMKKPEVVHAKSMDDYDIIIEPLDGLNMEVIPGI